MKHVISPRIQSPLNISDHLLAICNNYMQMIIYCYYPLLIAANQSLACTETFSIPSVKKSKLMHEQHFCEQARYAIMFLDEFRTKALYLFSLHDKFEGDHFLPYKHEYLRYSSHCTILGLSCVQEDTRYIPNETIPVQLFIPSL